VNTSGKVEAEIHKENPWYVNDQLTNLSNPYQIRTIRQRWGFINKCIESMHILRPDRKLKILDAGCGDGINLTILSKIPNASVTAYDYNPLRIERTREKFPDVRAVEQDLTNIQRGEDIFHIILCSQVLEHIPKDIVVLRELKKILSEDGVLIIGVPNEGCFLAKLRNRVLEPHISRTTDHVHFYTEKEILRKFATAGFRVTDKLYQGFFFPKQSMSNFFAIKEWGFNFMNILRKIFPTQVGGYYFVLKHDEENTSNQKPGK
jgi:2-polyprenyl-3-methyl-5-hydroxy-6-metoxy-1,4-benzoquinol methylase